MCRSRNIGYTPEAVPREAKIPSRTTELRRDRLVMPFIDMRKLVGVASLGICTGKS